MADDEVKNDAAATEAGTEEPSTMPDRRAFIGNSGRLLVYVPPLIQLFIPTKALAASPSSG